MSELQLMEVLRDLVRKISPWIEQAEMQSRYSVTGQTLKAMERRGEIPKRVNGRWLREEVVLREMPQKLPTKH